MRRDWESLVTTEQLVEFGRRHGVPLGRRNPKRTLNYYIRFGLLPPRHRTSDGRFRWGFPPHAKARLLRIRDLKREGLTLEQIRHALAEDVKGERAAQRRQASEPRLTGLPGLRRRSLAQPVQAGVRKQDASGHARRSFNPAEWDYTSRYHALQARAALEAIDRGDTEAGRRILREMLELAGRLKAGHRFKGVIDSAESFKLGPADFSALVEGDVILLLPNSPTPMPPRADVEAFVHSDEVPGILRDRGVDPHAWSRMSSEERRTMAAFVLDNVQTILPQEGQVDPPQELVELSPSSPPAPTARPHAQPKAPRLAFEKRRMGRLPGEWPSL